MQRVKIACHLELLCAANDEGVGICEQPVRVPFSPAGSRRRGPTEQHDAARLGSQPRDQPG